MVCLRYTSLQCTNLASPALRQTPYTARIRPYYLALHRNVGSTVPFLSQTRSAAISRQDILALPYILRMFTCRAAHFERVRRHVPCCVLWLSWSVSQLLHEKLQISTACCPELGLVTEAGIKKRVVRFSGISRKTLWSRSSTFFSPMTGPHQSTSPCARQRQTSLCQQAKMSVSTRTQPKH